MLRRAEERQWDVRSYLVQLSFRPSQFKAYREVLAKLSPYGSSSFCAPALRRICTLVPASGALDEPLHDMSEQQLLEGSAKLTWLRDFLDEKLLDPSARIIIFFDIVFTRDLLFYFFEHLCGNNLSRDTRPAKGGLWRLLAATIPIISGSQDTEFAVKALKDFESGKTPVVIASRGSAGRAMNMPWLTHVINWEGPSSVRLWWQGVYRGVRPPRLESVPLYIWDLVIKDSIEEGQFLARWAREALGEAIIPGDGGDAQLSLKRSLLDCGQARVSGALRDLSEKYSRKPLGERCRPSVRGSTCIELRPESQKAYSFQLLLEGLLPQAAKDRADARAATRRLWKVIVDANASLAGGVAAGTLRSGSSREHSGAAAHSDDGSPQDISLPAAAVQVPSTPLESRRMWVRMVFFDEDERIDKTWTGQIRDVAVTGHLTIFFPGDPSRPATVDFAELNASHDLYLVSDKTARADIDAARHRDQGGASSQPPATPRRAGARAYPSGPASREVAALLHVRSGKDDSEEELDDERGDPNVNVEDLESEDEDIFTEFYQDHTLRHLFHLDDIREVNEENAQLAQKKFERLLKSGSTSASAKAAVARMPLELEITPDDLEVTNQAEFTKGGVPKALKLASRRRAAQIEVRPRVLLAGLAKGKKACVTADQVQRIPRGLSINRHEELRERLAVLGRGLCMSTIKVTSGAADNFTTLTVRIAPHDPAPVPRPSVPPRLSVLSAVIAPLHDARQHLRHVAFHLRVAKLQVPSRETEQSFWGHSGNHAREGAIKALAFGPHRGKHVSDIEHHTLRVPTLVHSEYLEHGEHRLGGSLSQLVLAQHKHIDDMVLHGPWAGMAVRDAFGAGLEMLGQQCSSAFLLLVARASLDHAAQFLDSVAPSVRLRSVPPDGDVAGKGSIAIHTTEAFYSSGPLLSEARQYLREVKSNAAHTASPPGAQLASAIAGPAASRHSALVGSLPAEAQELIKHELEHVPQPLLSMGACLVSGTAAGARERLNALASDGRIQRVEVHHLPGREGGEGGSQNFTPESTRRLFEDHAETSWLPEWFDIDYVDVVEGVQLESARFLALNVKAWLDRLLAGFARRYARIGYDDVCASMRKAGRSKAALKAFTHDTFEQVACRMWLVSLASWLEGGWLAGWRGAVLGAGQFAGAWAVLTRRWAARLASAHVSHSKHATRRWFPWPTTATSRALPVCSPPGPSCTSRASNT